MTEDIEAVAAVETRVLHNGLTAPKKGGKCDAIWQICYDFGKEKGVVPAAPEVVALAVAAGHKEGTTRSQYSLWKKYNGIAVYIPSPQKVAKWAVKIEQKMQRRAARQAAKNDRLALKAQSVKIKLNIDPVISSV